MATASDYSWIVEIQELPRYVAGLSQAMYGVFYLKPKRSVDFARVTMRSLQRYES